ncbi:hypothetical protein SAMN05444166_7611 [Singulisphaera sp. GP187]|nr:hypothetical protein SAMN05444166_7611 [Singulisphaera sp. GP187]
MNSGTINRGMIIRCAVSLELAWTVSPVKLLCRTLDLRYGRVSFSTDEAYLEAGLFD